MHNYPLSADTMAWISFLEDSDVILPNRSIGCLSQPKFSPIPLILLFKGTTVSDYIFINWVSIGSVNIIFEYIGNETPNFVEQSSLISDSYQVPAPELIAWKTTYDQSFISIFLVKFFESFILPSEARILHLPLG